MCFFLYLYFCFTLFFISSQKKKKKRRKNAVARLHTIRVVCSFETHSLLAQKWYFLSSFLRLVPVLQFHYFFTHKRKKTKKENKYHEIIYLSVHSNIKYIDMAYHYLCTSIIYLHPQIWCISDYMFDVFMIKYTE